MIESILKYWPVLVVFASLISSWVAWSARKQFVSHRDLGASEVKTGKRIGAVENRVMALEQDMAVIRTKLDNLPTKADIAKVELAVSNVSGDLKGISASLKAMERVTHLITRAKMGVEE
ncbi:MAG: DUF2730 domain-containing protein [Deltaproteobacteria bacterium]|jgi:hypothetical protein|nr:DUF2730 domain-containing protein [Deltaproteobacteria bacterium]